MEAKKRTIIITGALVAALVISVGYYGFRAKAPVTLVTAEGTTAVPAVAVTEESDQANAEAVTMVQVHVAGAVNAPGVYTLPEGSRVANAVDMAGGMTPEADTKLNLARLITDGEQILVPKAGESVDKTAFVEDNRNNESLVNINTATLSQLTALPGVGDAIAARIIEYREANNGFQTKMELLQVKGIGEKTYEVLENLISVY